MSRQRRSCLNSSNSHQPAAPIIRPAPTSRKGRIPSGRIISPAASARPASSMTLAIRRERKRRIWLYSTPNTFGSHLANGFPLVKKEPRFGFSFCEAIMWSLIVFVFQAIFVSPSPHSSQANSRLARCCAEANWHASERRRAQAQKSQPQPIARRTAH
jgi:hypothetical protein